MALVFDPFRDVDRLTSQLMSSMSQGRGPHWMPLDLYRSGDHYVVNIDLPGVDPGSIDLTWTATPSASEPSGRCMPTTGRRSGWPRNDRPAASCASSLSATALTSPESTPTTRTACSP